MNDREIDEFLKRAAEGGPGVDPGLLDHIEKSIRADARPCAPLPGAGVLTGSLVLICAAMASAVAVLLGPRGIKQMSLMESALILPALILLTLLAAIVCVREIIPGSRRWMAPGTAAATCCVLLAVLFVMLFHNYATDDFVSQGIKCLTAGLAEAIPASLGIWLILRRGYPVNPAASGFARGTLSGLVGVFMLSLHCPRFEVPHFLLWHLAVIPVSGFAGMLIARANATRRRVTSGG